MSTFNRIVFASVVAATFLVYLILYFNINLKPNKKKIWVPPKEQQTLPFLPPAEEPGPVKYQETTYVEHENQLLLQAALTLLAPAVICSFLSYKYSVHVSLAMQSITIPMGLLDFPIFQKYIIGKSNDKMYKELFEKPDTVEIRPENEAAGISIHQSNETSTPLTAKKVN